MQAISRFILMLREQKAASRICPPPKGANTKTPLAVDAHGMPVRILITEGTRADCNQQNSLSKE